MNTLHQGRSPTGDAANSVIVLSELIEHSRLGSYQIRIMVLCALAVVFDGFDVQAMGFVAPALRQDWQVAPAVFGPIFQPAWLAW